MPLLQKLFFTLALVASSSIACLLIVIIIHRILRVRQDRIHKIVLKNEGNIPSVYYLSVDAQESTLEFKFLANNIPLARVVQPQVLAAPAEPQPTPIPQQPKTDAKPTKTGINVDNAAKGGRAVASKIGFVATFMGALGGLLPGSLGSSLRTKGAQARQVQSDTTQAVQAPVNAQRRAESLQQMSGGKGSKTTSIAAPKGKNQFQATSQADPQVGGSKESLPASHQQPANTRTPTFSRNYSVQTTEIQPGGAQEITLTISSSKRRYPQGSFLYSLWSQQVPTELVSIEIPPLHKNGTVHFKPISRWRYWLSPLVAGFVLSATSLAVIYFMTLIW